VTAAALLYVPPRYAAAWELWLGAALVVVIWLSTALVQVPQHGRLASGFDGGVVRALVVGNVVRTAAWTVRALLVGVWLMRGLGDRLPS
jgi:hypothetical protein